MSDFGNTILECSLLDVGFTGSLFTWERNSGLKQRLDRILFNQSFLTMFPSTKVNVGLLHSSDHRPLTLTAKIDSSFIKSSFKFQNMWLKDKRFFKVCKDNWSIPVRSSGMKKVWEKP